VATRNVYDPAPLANQHLGNNRAATQKGAAQVCLYVKPPFVGIGLPDRPYRQSTTGVVDEEVYWSKIGLYALYHRLYGVWVGHVSDDIDRPTASSFNYFDSFPQLTIGSRYRRNFTPGLSKPNGERAPNSAPRAGDYRNLAC